MNAAYSIAAVAIGAMIGALTRYGLSLGLNAYLPTIPLGTLVANLIAAYFVGFAASFFASLDFSPLWKLFIITGLAGGLSTFSSFSIELLALLREGRLGWSAAMLVLHVGGSLVMTALGMLSFSALRPS